MVPCSLPISPAQARVTTRSSSARASPPGSGFACDSGIYPPRSTSHTESRRKERYKLFPTHRSSYLSESEKHFDVAEETQAEDSKLDLSGLGRVVHARPDRDHLSPHEPWSGADSCVRR